MHAPPAADRTAHATPAAGAAAVHAHPLRPDGLRLRPWQRVALARFEAGAARDFLAVATPGAGKTTFALTAARRALVARAVRRVVIVVPTQHLKHQWAHAAERLDIHLDPEWTVGYGGLPSDVHGIVVTYQQVAGMPLVFRDLCRNAFVVLDEVHHAGESRSWGDGVRSAFEWAWKRLCLSGTPFRSDQITIPFIRYHGNVAQPDFEYGYGDALRDGRVVRPVYFPRINGRMEWTAPDGQIHEATFQDALTRDLASQRLRTALDVSGEWLPVVLAQAHAQLVHLRERDPKAGGLVIAMDQDHARGIAAILSRKLGVTATVATSDDPSATEKIGRFAEGSAPWIVAVRMVSEGVDIPRLRVGVYATNTVTELFFRQAVGRLVRWNAHLRAQAAYMFIPDDARLRSFGGAIAEQRRHNLSRDRRREGLPEPELLDPRGVDPDAEADQLSLFAAISAVPLDEDGTPLRSVRVFGADAESEAGGGDEVHEEEGDDIPDLVLTLPAGGTAAGAAADGSAPALGTGALAVPMPEPDPHPPRLDHPRAHRVPGALARRRALREANSDAVRALVRIHGRTHAEVNAELNQMIGVRQISLATVKQLEQRLTLARAMMTKRR